MKPKIALKYLASLLFCNVYRFLRLFPNNDPLIGFALPFARTGKWWHSTIFVFIAVFSFDFLTSGIGIWTYGTALAYSLVTLMFHLYVRHRKEIGLAVYAKSSIVGILVFDFLTGPVLSSYAFGMPFEVAFFGQIPFTLTHLASGLAFTLMLAPVLDPAVGKSVYEKLVRLGVRVKHLLSSFDFL